jgi:carbon-monoxide dehydrogenase large subunit
VLGGVSETVRIAMWSGPRNISTAMMRAWENRGDTAVWDEPLYAYYLESTGIEHPGAAEVIAAGETDWRRVVAAITGPVPDGKPIFFQKHMTHHMLDEVDRQWLSHLSNCFLIRDPREVIASYARTRPDVNLSDVGVLQQAELFEQARDLTGTTPLVLDARDVLEDPRAMFIGCCLQRAHVIVARGGTQQRRRVGRVLVPCRAGVDGIHPLCFQGTHPSPAARAAGRRVRATLPKSVRAATMPMNDIPVERYGVGQPIRRKEDRRFLTGEGRYVDDVSMPDMAHMVILRSPHAHADIASIDTQAAAEAPGVLCVLTGADWVADELGGIPTRTAAKNSDDSPVPVPDRPGLVATRARFVGDAVAAVVAESATAARDAAELIEVDYRALPAVVSAGEALAPGAPLVWDDIAGNLCVEFEVGDAAAVAEAIDSAAHVVTLSVDNQRVTAAPIETRGAIGDYVAAEDRYQLVFASQNVHANRNQLAENVLHISPEQLRAVAYDVGGGFGAKNPLYPEHALVLWASRRVGRPVKWISDRGEGFLSDAHGRDQQSEVTLALSADGDFLALRVDSVGSVGPYVLSVGPFTCTAGSARTQGGPYRIPALHFHARAAFTNTAPTDPYRGAGRPEATYHIERIVDLAAAELGMDRVEIRRRNLIGREELPHTTGAGARIDCGDFETVLDRTLALADWDGFEARASEARARGVRRGIGVCAYLECSGGGPKEHAALRFSRDGGVTLAVGSQSTGTGHETVMAQIVAARLGLPIDAIDFHQADTDATPIGGGHGGSRGMEMGGSAVVRVTDKVLDKARVIAAHLLEAATVDVELDAGSFRVAGTDHAVDMQEVIRASFDAARRPDEVDSLDDSHDYERSGITYPNGCHIAEVEVDPETGSVVLVDYSIVDDFGTIVNPLTCAGQVMGGSAQGIGQALLEEVVYEDSSGQLLSGSFMDYGLPRADDVPDFRIEFFEGAPSGENPLGAKGAGEAGCCGALPAVVGAVMHALEEYGVRHVDMPLDAEKLWRAISGAERS